MVEALKERSSLEFVQCDEAIAALQSELDKVQGENRHL